MGEPDRTLGRTQPYLWESRETVTAEDAVRYRTQDLPKQLTDIAPTLYRTETALNRYPIHRLSRGGVIEIDITERDEAGHIVTKWQTSYNSRYGQPGPLAYRLDTLIVQRALDRAEKPYKRLLRLGSLSDIAKLLGMSDSGLSYLHLRRALRQNAHTAIDALISWRDAEKQTQVLEASFSRYSVIFRGERIPEEERSADAVYLLLNDLYLDIINRAVTRPLDYEYCYQLAPAPHRWYELVSYQIYACLRYGLPHALYSYRELCTHAPLTYYADHEQARKQLYKIHRPHIESGYIKSAGYRVNESGELILMYQPGERARREYRESMKYAKNVLY